MKLTWEKDENYKAISIYLTNGFERIALHFEDALSESCWTFANGKGEILSDAIPKELVDALYEHIKDRKC